ncbi:MAG: clostripain-related cysteine peptidase [Pyrinomonadaceae bacterium]
MKEWTIMVYMAGDNNLSENMAYSLADLDAGFNDSGLGTADKVNLLAFFDSASLTAPTTYFDYSDGKTIAHPIEPDDIYHKKRNTPPPDEYDLDGNAASAYSIMNFVRWCIETRERTATNYALIFSGHSFGFHGTSFLRDESSGGFMTLFKFRWALEEVMKQYLGNKQIAILGFDSCVMSMLEVAYEIKNTAQTMVASEGSLPNSGWGYAPLLRRFVGTFGKEQRADNKSFNAWIETDDYVKEAAKSFVTAFVEHHNRLLIGGRSVDIAAWDLGRIKEVCTSFNDLASGLNEVLDLAPKINDAGITDDDIFLYHELKKVVLQSQFDAQAYMKNQCVDLYDFCERLSSECEFMGRSPFAGAFESIGKAADQVRAAVDACILKAGFSGEEYQFSNGISVYFPWTYLTYRLTDHRYRYLRVNRGGRENKEGICAEWNRFLGNYLSRVTFRLARDGKDRVRPAVASDGAETPAWSKDNPRWTKDNPRWTKDNPPLCKDNPRFNRDNPRFNRGEVGEYLFYFERFKNFQLGWDITGYAEDFKEDKKVPAAAK